MITTNYTTEFPNNHDDYLYHCWNNTKKHHKHTSTNKQASAVKDELSTTHTLDTLCTLDTSDPDKKLAATNMLINLMIWNQQIIRYQIPNQPNTTTTQSWLPCGTAVQYALIGVNEKLPNPPSHHRPVYTICSNSVCVVVLMSCSYFPC